MTRRFHHSFIALGVSHSRYLCRERFFIHFSSCYWIENDTVGTLIDYKWLKTGRWTNGFPLIQKIVSFFCYCHFIDFFFHIYFVRFYFQINRRNSINESNQNFSISVFLPCCGHLKKNVVRELNKSNATMKIKYGHVDTQRYQTFQIGWNKRDKSEP